MNSDFFLDQLPPKFKEFVASCSSAKGPREAFMTHCHREFFHAQWRELLDDEFLDAYEHGVVIKCCDGITRRFYPRIFAYSADYPEKLVPTHLHMDLSSDEYSIQDSSQ